MTAARWLSNDPHVISKLDVLSMCVMFVVSLIVAVIFCFITQVIVLSISSYDPFSFIIISIYTVRIVFIFPLFFILFLPFSRLLIRRGFFGIISSVFLSMIIIIITIAILTPIFGDLLSEEPLFVEFAHYSISYGISTGVLFFLWLAQKEPKAFVNEVIASERPSAVVWTLGWFAIVIVWQIIFFWAVWD